MKQTAQVSTMKQSFQRFRHSQQNPQHHRHREPDFNVPYTRVIFLRPSSSHFLSNRPQHRYGPLSLDTVPSASNARIHSRLDINLNNDSTPLAWFTVQRNDAHPAFPIIDWRVPNNERFIEVTIFGSDIRNSVGTSHRLPFFPIPSPPNLAAATPILAAGF